MRSGKAKGRLYVEIAHALIQHSEFTIGLDYSDHVLMTLDALKTAYAELK
jgi:hypothetical protein